MKYSTSEEGYQSPPGIFLGTIFNPVGDNMTRRTGILSQEEVDALLGKPKEAPCEKCEDLKREIKATQKTLNTMLNSAASELEAVKKENEELRSTIEKLAKD